MRKEAAVVRRRLSLAALALMLLAGISPLSARMFGMAKKFNVDTAPIAGGRVYLDGNFVGVAPCEISLKFPNDMVHVITAELPGCVTFAATRVNEDWKGPITLRLETDTAKGVTN